MKKRRIIYGAVFVILFLIEVLIALFVHDGFIRPYFGDVLVTILLCCFYKTIVPKGVSAIPIYVFIFAVLVEVAQFFNVVTLLGVENNVVLCTIIGTSFSFFDIICYGIGCLAFFVVEKAILSFSNE